MVIRVEKDCTRTHLVVNHHEKKGAPPGFEPDAHAGLNPLGGSLGHGGIEYNTREKVNNPIVLLGPMSFLGGADGHPAGTSISCSTAASVSHAAAIMLCVNNSPWGTFLSVDPASFLPPYSLGQPGPSQKHLINHPGKNPPIRVA